MRVLQTLTALITISVLLSGCVTSSREEHRATLFLEMGIENLEKGEYPQALQSLLEGYRLDPNNAQILNALGMTYFAQEQYQYAIDHLQKAIKKESNFSDAHNNLGRVLLSVGKFDSAEKHLKICLNDLTYPYPEKTLSNLGLLYFSKKDYVAAKEYYLRALKQNREFCPAYSQYGQTLLKMKDYEGAVLIFDRAIRICINNPEEVHYYSALSYYQFGKKDLATARLQEVIKLYPTSEYADKSRQLLAAIKQDIK